MRQFTTPEQTAKLIELGFEKPKSIEKMIPQPVVDGYVHLVPQKAYSIGELIEMLPKSVWSDDNNWPLMISTCVYDSDIPWSVSYIYSDGFMNIELIDALYDMVVKLKEKGVI